MASQHSTGDDLQRRKVVLDIPEPPSDLPYADLEDYRTRELLRVNGISLRKEALLSVIEGKNTVLKSTAAHALGSIGGDRAIPALERLASAGDDTAKVEAAYALVRLGIARWKSVLKECLTYPVNAYLCPSVAAGYLARLGDPDGFPVVVKSLNVDNLIVRRAACRQLFFFVPFQDKRAADGQLIDVSSIFDRCLHDPHRDVQWVALLQLRQMPPAQSRAMLESYAGRTADKQLRDTALDILARNPR